MSPKQKAFIERLLADRQVSDQDRAVMRDRLADWERVNTKAASNMIDLLMSCPKVQREAEQVDEGITPGVFEKDGEIYVVKPNRDKTRLYAKRVIEIQLSTPRVLEDGTEVNYDIEMEYAKGVIYKLSESDRMDTARAEELTIRYGRCIVCGARLKKAESVKRGIGPVCRKSLKVAEPVTA
jgi:hypothetical protein